jgi:hypothetical protein
MTALLDLPAATSRRRITVRPAPRREPPFDDELPPQLLHQVGPYDQQLPFERPARPVPVPDRPVANAGLPDPALWGRRLLIGIIEAAAGRRPLQQLGSLLSHSVAYGLRIDFERSARSGRRHWIGQAAIRTVRASEPADGVAELSATVAIGRRVRAVALRLEAVDGRWQCTRLQLG